MNFCLYVGEFGTSLAGFYSIEYITLHSVATSRFTFTYFFVLVKFQIISMTFHLKVFKLIFMNIMPSKHYICVSMSCVRSILYKFGIETHAIETLLFNYNYISLLAHTMNSIGKNDRNDIATISTLY